MKIFVWDLEYIQSQSSHSLEFHTLVLIFLPAWLRSCLLAGAPVHLGKKKEVCLSLSHTAGRMFI